MTKHPPTRCDRKLFLDECGKPIKVTPDDITKAVAWYEQNWLRINGSLPATVGATTFTQRWQDGFDRAVLPQWRAGKLKHRLAVAYVYAALRQLYKAIKEKNDSTLLRRRSLL